jgi:hypothetical protein
MKATGNDRTNFQPMSELYETIDLHWEFSPEEFRNIEMGRVPLDSLRVPRTRNLE